MGKIEQKTLPQWKQEGNKIPGFGENRLTKTNVRLNSGGGNVKIGQFTFTSNGNISVTGVGFKPNLVQFNVFGASRSGSGAMTTNNQYATSFHDTTTTSFCILIYDTGGTQIGRGAYVSMDADGFTVNISNSNGTTIYVNRIAFG